MNTKPILVLTLVVSLTLGGFAAPVAAQKSTAEPTSTPTATTTSTPTNSTALLAIDEQTTLVDKSYNRDTGVLTLTFESDRYAPVSLFVIEDTDASTGSATYASRFLQPGQQTEVQIQAPPDTRVWISTDQSQENGVVHFVKTTDGSPLIGGPFTGADVRNGAFAASLGTALMILYRLVREHTAVDKNGERVA